METGNKNIAEENFDMANMTASTLTNPPASENSNSSNGSSKSEKDNQEGDSEKNNLTESAKALKNIQSITDALISNFGMLKKEAKSIASALGTFSTETSSLLDGISELGKKTTKSLEDSKAAVNSTGDGVKDVGKAVDGTTKGVEGTGEIAAQSIGKVEKASVILTIISAAVKIAMAIAKLITDFVSKDSKLEEKIQENQKQLDEKIKAYEALKESMEKVYSSDKYQNLERQKINLQEQKALIEEQKSWEEEKKQSDKDDIAEYEENLEEINKEIAAIRDQQIEAIMGKDVQDALNDFAEAYVQAWQTGEDKAKSMKNVVRDLFRSVIIGQLKEGLQPQVKALMDDLTDKIYAGESIADNTLDEYVNGLLKDSEGIMQLYGRLLNYGQESSATSSSSGVTGELQEAMTEGTASQLVGLWNMTSSDLREIKTYLLNQADTICIGWDNVQAISEDTAQISYNTLEMSRTLRSIDKRIYDIETKLTGNSRVIN